MSYRFADLPPHIQVAFDISPLGEIRFTGISNVVAKLLAHLRSVCGGRLHAFSCGVVVPEAVISEVLASASGVALREFKGGRSVFSLVAERPDQTFLGLFGGVKTVNNLFPFEAQIVYDLTILLTRECHSRGAMDHHLGALERDSTSNDLSICISNATRDDFITYLGVAPQSAIVIPPGVDPPRNIESQLRSFDERYKVEPYFIVLNTIEPRKNVPLVLRMMREHAGCVDGLLAVFVGHHGWGPSFAGLIAEAGLTDMFASGRIRHLGYVGDLEREVLLRKAEFLIYPSFYEGFGLPVLEALRVGCPVVSSFSSSLPEAGGDAACYFDPLDAASLANAITRMRVDLAADATRVRKRGQAHAAHFGWDRFCAGVEAAVCRAAAAKLGLNLGR
ncbi:MAG TPA: glycosyltransferase family 1 protein [Xanthobacteraceae bacterium]|jgi:glycosyltransferase involved in cell wall biosynthesis|nr:glycosyltransferase family 1 protein [Xanthobacteraceae bacterium]